VLYHAAKLFRYDVGAWFSSRWLARSQFMWSLDVPEDEVDFHDVYGLDEDVLEITLCARRHSLLPGSTTGNYILMLQKLLGSVDLGDI
jgi:hypothetical protein